MHARQFGFPKTRERIGAPAGEASALAHATSGKEFTQAVRRMKNTKRAEPSLRGRRGRGLEILQIKPPFADGLHTAGGPFPVERALDAVIKALRLDQRLDPRGKREVAQVHGNDLRRGCQAIDGERLVAESLAA